MEMIKVYLAARWERQEELRAYRNEMFAQTLNLKCTSSWLDVVAGSSLSPTGDGLTHNDHALNDLTDVEWSDWLVLFTEDGPTPRNGRMVEFGFALARRKRVAIVGPRENLFCHLYGVGQFDTWADCLRAIAEGGEQ